MNDSIANVLKQFGQDADVRTAKKSNELSLNLFFKSPYFVDFETQKMILSVLYYKMYDCYKNYDKIFITYINEGFENDPLYYTQSKEDNENVYNYFANNKVFLKQVEYVLSTMKQEEILAGNEIIKELKTIIPDLFDFTGSFWLLLHEYSMNYNQKESKEFKNFSVFVKAASVEGSHVDPEHLQKLKEIPFNSNE